MRLREALDGVPDHRSSQGRRHPLGAVLSLAVCAMLCGARSLYAIAQWGRDHGAAAGEALGFPLGKTPCVATLHRVFKDLDVAAFEEVLREWVKDSGADLGSVVSVDGKTLRGIHGEEIPGVHLVSAYAAGSGAVLGQIPLEGKIVVADALLTQREVCQQIVAGGGDCLLPVKENQPTLQRDLADAFSPSGKRRGPRAGSGGLARTGMAGARDHADALGG